LYEGQFVMAKTTFSGPVYSGAGFGTPLQYITAADTSPIAIDPGATVIILSQADGGPSGTVVLTLPQVQTTDGQAFNITNADPRYVGIRGAVLNYDASITHTLAGYEVSTGVYQPVNGSATGVDLAPETLTQWAGNGNPTAAWAAAEASLNAAA
jgi:hypothetical protein